MYVRKATNFNDAQLGWGLHRFFFFSVFSAMKTLIFLDSTERVKNWENGLNNAMNPILPLDLAGRFTPCHISGGHTAMSC